MKDDLIRRSDAIKAIEELPNCYNGWSDTYDKAYIIGTLEEVPSADVIERERGEWIDEADKYDASFGIHDYRCSNCNSCADEHIGGHEWYTMLKPNFCPNCGADMRAEQTEPQTDCSWK